MIWWSLGGIHALEWPDGYRHPAKASSELDHWESRSDLIPCNIPSSHRLGVFLLVLLVFTVSMTGGDTFARLPKAEAVSTLLSRKQVIVKE